ncbi:putative galactosyltransferase [Teratosphaeria nubilosa]|uniref:N-acetylgalactosaminide beta-1,3-galactosyltransferase n=1 Tax=Teratosphaeria nubilosa TaxID=161662 RepID=A0A6G1KZR0_9PEZI|nr:putative galactosyltransferase [Teratosphaeria nubilosa]
MAHLRSSIITVSVCSGLFLSSTTSRTSPLWQPLPCQKLTGAEDVVVVMRTGATEIKDKLPIHFRTTFQCYPDYIIFSDYEEVFEGHQVYDALASVPLNTKKTNDDFGHYLHLQDVGRENLHDAELHGESYESGPGGKKENPGWRLDKWKFLPMASETLRLRPDKKWYIFVEPDSYIVWSNMIQWLRRLDPSKASYFGSEVQIASDIFAHGGTGFVMSRPALEKGVNEYKSHLDEWHDKTANHWAGDCILGMALTAAGVGLTWSWPMFQGGNPSDMTWDEKKMDHTLWCTPALSYHHFNAHEVEAMWWFEQNRIASSLPRQPAILHHREVFRSYALPNMTLERDGWSNKSPENVTNSENWDIKQCRAACENNDECMQYELTSAGCAWNKNVNMGTLAQGTKSGWVVERIEKWAHSIDKSAKCGRHRGWTVGT